MTDGTKTKLEKLSPEQLASLRTAVNAESVRRNAPTAEDQAFRRKVTTMTDNEFAAWKREQGG